MLLLVAGARAALADGLSASPTLSTDGVYQLAWSTQGPVVLEEARRPDFTDARVLYSGEDGATTLSGRDDGTYYYRLRRATAGADETDEVLKVEVRHHPLSRALGFFALGAVVFVSTVALIVSGGRQSRAQS